MGKRMVFLFLILLSLNVAGQLDCTIQTSSGDTAFCYGEKVLLYTVFADTLNYYWEPGGETGVIIEVTVTGPVTYILHTYNNDSSFYCNDSITLYSLPYPTLDIQHFPDPIPVHAVVTFSFGFISGDIGQLAHWEWIIDDSVFTDVLTPEYVLHDPGTYYVRLNYQTTDSCWISMEEYVEVSYSSVNEIAVHNFSISPNPAKDQLTFSFILEEPAKVELVIYNETGQRVRTIIPASHLQGRQNAAWDASAMPPGLYFAKLTVDRKSYNAKIVVR